MADHGEAESFSLDALAAVLSGASGLEVFIFRAERSHPMVFDYAPAQGRVPGATRKQQ